MSETLQGIGKQEMEHSLYRCPDFVIELPSSSDRLKDAKEKMERWIENGAALGWLIDPCQRRVFVYSRERKPTVSSADLLRGSGPVAGLTLNLSEVWNCYDT
jgi:Uma2 family endonuclease